MITNKSANTSESHFQDRDTAPGSFGVGNDLELINSVLMSMARDYFPGYQAQKECRCPSDIGSPETLDPCVNHGLENLPEMVFSPLLLPETNMRASGNSFDVNTVRKDFPILSENVDGKKLVWFDNAATTQKPLQVIERIGYFYKHENSNIHRAAHTLAARTTDAYEDARKKAASFLHAARPDEIIFVRGATEAINLAAQSFGQQNLGEGDEVIITLLEHHANIVPWQMICARTGARLRAVPVDEDGQVLLSEYEKLLSSRTKIVALTHVSNALGTITPAAQMAEMAHRFGARVLVDGAQAVSHMKVDVQALDSDFYVFSGHKIFGPTGIGVLYGKGELLESMPPYQGGGNMISDVTFEKTRYKSPPHRFEAGTGNISGAIALGSALDYVTSIGLDSISAYEHGLLEYAREAMGKVPGLLPVGNAAQRTGILSFVLQGYKDEEVGKALNDEGIAVRTGHHCSQPILRRYGLESTIRASLSFYNTREEINFFVSVLQKLARSR